MSLPLFRTWVLVFIGLLLSPASWSAASLNDLCVERGGTALAQRHGEDVCFADIPPKECIARGGMWAVFDGEPRMGCRIDLSAQARIDACRAQGWQWGRHGTTDWFCRDPRGEQDCRAKGGAWVQQGIRGMYGCVLKANDAGKACRNGSECQFGRCVYIEATQLPGRPRTGSCAATDSHFGCFSQVENGVVLPTVCAD